MLALSPSGDGYAPCEQISARVFGLRCGYYSESMTWWLWTLAFVLAVPILSAVVGFALLLLAFLIPERLMPRGCGCCGRTGYWTRRSSSGAYICDDCGRSGGHRHETFEL